MERDAAANDAVALHRSSSIRVQAAYTHWTNNMLANSLRRQAHGRNISAPGNFASAVITLGGGAWNEWKANGAAKKELPGFG